jgi:8-oxo-dGTP pyrophosphatase MutT (NUDIX family)
MYDRRYAIFVLRDRQGRILLQKRDKKAPRNPGKWGFFGGNIREDETPPEALRREAREELGLKKVGFTFFGRYETREKDELHEKFLFEAPLKDPLGKLRKQQREGKELGLFSFDDIKGLNVPKVDVPLLFDLFGKRETSGILYVRKPKE